jgi:hypothetical protein
MATAKEMQTMPIDKNSEENIPDDSDAYAYYEAVASQEEIYLEEVEEELRAILIFGDETPSRNEARRSPSDANNDPRRAEGLEEQLTHAAEELITADSDDLPLIEEVVADMLRMAKITKGFRSDI